MSAGYRGFAVSASASASYSNKSNHQDGSAKQQSTAYLVGTYEVHKAKVYIPPELIELTDSVEDIFKQFVLTRKNKAIKESNQTIVDTEKLILDIPSLLELKQLFDMYGYFVITEYTLGGKLYTSETVKKDGVSNKHLVLNVMLLVEQWLLWVCSLIVRRIHFEINYRI